MATLDARHARPLPSAPNEIRWAAARSLWLIGLAAAWIGLGAATFSVGAVAVWAVSTAVTLCFGHSVGLHRGVIHGAFRMGKGTERVLVYLATLCGLGGPLMMYRIHQIRDYWQNQRRCPDYYSYDHSLARDFIWYLHMDHVPARDGFEPDLPAEFTGDRFYRFLDRTWMLQQVPVALLLYGLGGPGFVVWGVAGRVVTAVLGHWIVNYFAHTRGYRSFELEGGEEGRNNLWFGALSMGEGWHNNHHAYPQSARLGLAPHELDPGWWAVGLLQRLGLIWDVKAAEDLPLRSGGVALPVGSLRAGWRSSSR